MEFKLTGISLNRSKNHNRRNNVQGSFEVLLTFIVYSLYGSSVVSVDRHYRPTLGRYIGRYID